MAVRRRLKDLASFRADLRIARRLPLAGYWIEPGHSILPASLQM